MSNDIQIALVGVIGTLAGTFLGWLLNSLSQKGKLSIFVTSFEDGFQHKDALCQLVPCDNASQAEYYSCKVSLDVYNSSAETRIMRNIQIVFAKDKKEIMACTPDNYATERFGAGRIRYDKIGPVNIPPKSIITMELRFADWDSESHCEKYWEVNNIFLRYTDKKNNVKKASVSTKDYECYFLNI